MKKLTLKETAAPKVERKTKANLILSEARKEMKRFAHLETVLMYQSLWGREPNFSEDEEWTVATGDLADDVYVDVLVRDNFSSNQKTYERIEIAKVRAALDGSVFLADEDGEEWSVEEISIEDLANVCDILENSYYGRTHGLL